MKIGYVAKHDSGGNDDEGAIHHALEQLGHRVERLRESRSHVMHKLDCDFLLFHHFPRPEELPRVEKPKVFWCFDRIYEPNCPELETRNQRRVAWANAMERICDLGFYTDGDWVANDAFRLTRWLPQGADERFVGTVSRPKDIDILFVGATRGCGSKRESFVAEMSERYGSRFVHVAGKCHGEALKEMVARARIVVAPDFPCSDRYWSNRVYLMLGFGAFLLHPWSKGLEDQLGSGVLRFYRDRDHLHQMIRARLDEPATRGLFAADGFNAIVYRQLYRHRCAELVRIMKERL